MDKDVEQRATVCRWFAEELKRFRIQAGKPTYKALEALSKKRPDLRPLNHSTVNDALRNKYSRIPDWEWVFSFVTICQVYAEQSHARLGRLADVQAWQRRWYMAKRSCLDTGPWPIAAADPTDPPEVGGGDGTHTGAAQSGEALRSGGDEPARRAAMLALARQAQTLGWWQRFGDVVPDWFAVYLSLEPAAGLIRTYDTWFVPDLVQTEDYARSVLRLAQPGATAVDIERRVELRMRRQQILHRPTPPKLWVVIDEQALRHPRVPAATMRSQLEHLIQLGEQPNITVQVMRSGDGTAGGPITVLRFPQRELPDVVYLEQLTGGLYPDRPDDIHHYRQVLDRLGIEATMGDATTDILKRILTEI